MVTRRLSGPVSYAAVSGEAFAVRDAGPAGAPRLRLLALLRKCRVPRIVGKAHHERASRRKTVPSQPPHMVPLHAAAACSEVLIWRGGPTRCPSLFRLIGARPRPRGHPHPPRQPPDGNDLRRVDPPGPALPGHASSRRDGRGRAHARSEPRTDRGPQPGCQDVRHLTNPKPDLRLRQSAAIGCHAPPHNVAANHAAPPTKSLKKMEE